jgi:hypothetical protein
LSYPISAIRPDRSSARRLPAALASEHGPHSMAAKSPQAPKQTHG